jgi:Domain of unknown function (DUF4124)
MRRVLCLLGLSALPLTSQAQIIYKCVDVDGGTRFTNIAAEAKGCEAVSMIPFESPAASATPSAPKPQSRAAPSPSPSSFPRIDRATQQARDNDRRRILEQELNQEQKLLAEAKQELAAQDHTVARERLEPYRRRVRMHEDNVANIRREISNLR